jgi:hypothetical protein
VSSLRRWRSCAGVRPRGTTAGAAARVGGLGVERDYGPLVGREFRPGLQPRQPRVEIRP